VVGNLKETLANIIRYWWVFLTLFFTQGTGISVVDKCLQKIWVVDVVISLAHIRLSKFVSYSWMFTLLSLALSLDNCYSSGVPVE
jgi:hypothetical protein